MKLKQIQQKRSFLKKQLWQTNGIQLGKHLSKKEQILLRIVKFTVKILINIHDSKSKKFGLNVPEKIHCDIIHRKIKRSDCNKVKNELCSGCGYYN